MGRNHSGDSAFDKIYNMTALAATAVLQDRSRVCQSANLYWPEFKAKSDIFLNSQQDHNNLIYVT